MASRKKTITVMLVLGVIIISVVWCLNFDHQRRQVALGTPYEEYTKDNPLSSAIEVFGEDKFARYGGEKSICAARELWNKDINSDKKIVLASINCMEFVADNGTFKANDSFMDLDLLFMLEKKDGIWQVTDYDDRNSEEAPTKDWVKEYISYIPADINTKIDRQFVWAKLISKASAAMNITTSPSSLKGCSYNSDCNSGEVCFLHNYTQYEAANKCVKRCSDHSSCGAGYLCRKKCINGADNCTMRSVNVCAPFYEMGIQDFVIPAEPF